MSPLAFPTTIDPAGEEDPLLPTRPLVADPGPALDLDSLQPTGELAVRVQNFRQDPVSGNWNGQLVVRNTRESGPAAGRQAVFVFRDLPAGVELVNRSGQDGDGNPYANMFDAIPNGGLRPGAESLPTDFELQAPASTAFSALLIDGDGSEVVYQAPLTVGGPFVSPPGRFDMASELPDGTFVRTDQFQNVFVYGTDGQLTSATDRLGNATTAQRDS